MYRSILPDYAFLRWDRILIGVAAATVIAAVAIAVALKNHGPVLNGVARIADPLS